MGPKQLQAMQQNQAGGGGVPVNLPGQPLPTLAPGANLSPGPGKPNPGKLRKLNTCKHTRALRARIMNTLTAQRARWRIEGNGRILRNGAISEVWVAGQLCGQPSAADGDPAEMSDMVVETC